MDTIELVRYIWAYHRVADRIGRRGAQFSDALACLRLGTYRTGPPFWEQPRRNKTRSAMHGCVLWLGTRTLQNLIDAGRRQGLQPIAQGRNVFAPEKNILQKLSSFPMTRAHEAMRRSFGAVLSEEPEDVTSLMELFDSRPEELRYAGDVIIGSGFPEFTYCIGIRKAHDLWARSPSERAAYLLRPMTPFPRSKRPAWFSPDPAFLRSGVAASARDFGPRYARTLDGILSMNGIERSDGSRRGRDSFIVIRTPEELVDLPSRISATTFTKRFVFQVPAHLRKPIEKAIHELQARTGRPVQSQLLSDRLLGDYFSLQPWLWKVVIGEDDILPHLDRERVPDLLGPLVLLESWWELSGGRIERRVAERSARQMALGNISPSIGELSRMRLLEEHAEVLARNYTSFGDALNEHRSFKAIRVRVNAWAFEHRNELPEPTREHVLRSLVIILRAEKYQISAELYERYHDIAAGLQVAFAIPDNEVRQELLQTIANISPEARLEVRDAEFKHLFATAASGDFLTRWLEIAERHEDAIRILPLTMHAYADALSREDRDRMIIWWIESDRDRVELVDALEAMGERHGGREAPTALRHLRQLKNIAKSEKELQRVQHAIAQLEVIGLDAVES